MSLNLTSSIHILGDMGTKQTTKMRIIKAVTEGILKNNHPSYDKK